MNNWMFYNKESRKQLKDFVVGRSLGDYMVQLPHFSGGETDPERERDRHHPGQNWDKNRVSRFFTNCPLCL